MFITKFQSINVALANNKHLSSLIFINASSRSFTSLMIKGMNYTDHRVSLLLDDAHLVIERHWILTKFVS